MADRELKVRMCCNSYACCDGECAECPVTGATTSNRTEVTRSTMSNRTEVRDDNV